MAVKQDVYIDDYCDKDNRINSVSVTTGYAYVDGVKSPPALKFNQPVSCVLIEDLLKIIEILIKN